MKFSHLWLISSIILILISKFHRLNKPLSLSLLSCTFLCLVKVTIISLFLCQFGYFCLYNAGLCRAQFRVCHQSESVQWHGRWPSCVRICAHQGGDGTRTHLTTDPSCGAYGHCSVVHNSCRVLDWYHPVQESGSIIILAYWETTLISWPSSHVRWFTGD